MSTPSTEPKAKARAAVRAILITPQAEVLLMRIREPGSGDCFWITPGGGIESDESFEACLRRELQEELGLSQFEVGPLVWLRRHTFKWDGRRVRQSERYHVVAVERFEPTMSDLDEARALQEFRWWHVSELLETTERLTPLALGTIVLEYLRGSPQAGPLTEEILED